MLVALEMSCGSQEVSKGSKELARDPKKVRRGRRAHRTGTVRNIVLAVDNLLGDTTSHSDVEPVQSFVSSSSRSYAKYRTHLARYSANECEFLSISGSMSV